MAAEQVLNQEAVTCGGCALQHSFAIEQPQPTETHNDSHTRWSYAGLTLSPGGPEGPSLPDVPCNTQKPVVTLRVLCAEMDTRPSITAQISSDRKRLWPAAEQRYLWSWLPCWTPSSTTPTRALRRQKLKSQTRRIAKNFLLVFGSYVPLDPSVLWDQLFLQRPVKWTKINAHTHTHTRLFNVFSTNNISKIEIKLFFLNVSVIWGSPRHICVSECKLYLGDDEWVINPTNIIRLEQDYKTSQFGTFKGSLCTSWIKEVFGL